MPNCHFCGVEGGMHTPKCPLNPTTMNGNPNVPIIGQAGPKMIPSNYHCPVCGYRPPIAEGPEQETHFDQRFVMMIVDPDRSGGGQVVQRVGCPQCWARFVMRSVPILEFRPKEVAREEEEVADTQS